MLTVQVFPDPPVIKVPGTVVNPTTAIPISTDAPVEFVNVNVFPLIVPYGNVAVVQVAV